MTTAALESGVEGMGGVVHITRIKHCDAFSKINWKHFVTSS